MIRIHHLKTHLPSGYDPVSGSYALSGSVRRRFLPFMRARPLGDDDRVHVFYFDYFELEN